MSGNPNIDNTPELEEAIRGVIERRLVDVHTTMPGKVVKYDEAQQKADVQVQLQRRYVSGELKAIPVIPAVTVVWPRAAKGKAYFHMPLKVGDDVVLHFCERSLGNWKTQGGLSDPADKRKFDLSDAFCVPGGSAFPDAFEVEEKDAVEIANDIAKLQLFDDGKVKIQGGDDDELIKILYDLVTLIKIAQTATIFGPQPLVPATDPTWDLILLRIMAFKKG